MSEEKNMQENQQEKENQQEGSLSGILGIVGAGIGLFLGFEIVPIDPENMMKVYIFRGALATIGLMVGTVIGKTIGNQKE